jgi:hypothetical protein
LYRLKLRHHLYLRPRQPLPPARLQFTRIRATGARPGWKKLLPLLGGKVFSSSHMKSYLAT